MDRKQLCASLAQSTDKAVHLSISDLLRNALNENKGDNKWQEVADAMTKGQMVSDVSASHYNHAITQGKV